MSEDAIAARMLRKKYIESYGIVCNMFKKGTPLSMKEKRAAIKRVVFDDPDVAVSKAASREHHNMLLKVYDFAYSFHSPAVMAMILQAAYSLKYAFLPLYHKLAPRLLRK